MNLSLTQVRALAALPFLGYGRQWQSNLSRTFYYSVDPSERTEAGYAFVSVTWHGLTTIRRNDGRTETFTREQMQARLRANLSQ